MIEEEGNMWAMIADAHCVTTNGVVKPNGALVMGAGTALSARRLFPGIDLTLGRLVSDPIGGNVPYVVETDESTFITRIISFPTKHHWRDPSDINLIVQSSHLLMSIIQRWGFTSVILPRPGCGRGQLNWDDIRETLRPILDDRVTVVNSPDWIR